ncbi:pentatricopeptide repeat-containing protein At1g74630 [Selaginella moellendorffii]|nr:pentatricopeptide repeat-containing protein At1g74630 [Selaginella moellendorffii]|eukprot:XP_002976644.2 pentatricopeptide repeat-containing protein At1g74630 [Selaginella moellendorffii]
MEDVQSQALAIPAREKKRVRVNAAPYAEALQRFGNEKSLLQGKRFHALIAQRHHDRDTYIGNLLVQMYGKCGSMEDAELAFHRIAKPNIFSFNLLIAAYLQNDCSARALATFDRMISSSSVAPDAYTFSNAVTACSKLENLSRGEELHERIACSNLENTTVNGHSSQALALYSKMLEQGIQADDFTYSSVLSACSKCGSSDLRSQATGLLEKSMASASVVVKNAAVQLLGRCEGLSSARKKFEAMGAERNDVSWNSMIAAFAEHGDLDQAMELYREMELEGVQPSEVTFMSILRACSHSGELEQAIRSFGCMQHDHCRLFPLQQQYRCVVDVLGRAGWLDQAEYLICGTEELERDPVAWLTLLGACSVHRDVDRGIQVANRVVELDSKGAAAIPALVLLSNIFAAAGRWDDVASLRRVIDQKTGRQERIKRTCLPRAKFA